MGIDFSAYSTMQTIQGEQLDLFPRRSAQIIDLMEARMARGWVLPDGTLLSPWTIYDPPEPYFVDPPPHRLVMRRIKGLRLYIRTYRVHC